MRLARVLGAIGRGLISAGVIVLLFVAYQLWGTGLQNAAAQDDLEQDFIEDIGGDVASDASSLAEAARASQAAFQAGQVAATLPDDATTDSGPRAVGEPGAVLIQPDLNEAAYSEAFIAKLYPEPGEAFARIVMPDINVDQIAVEGVSVEDLRKGPGHYRTTPNPGQAGNASIAGHRTTYGAPFHRIDELQPGASIFVTTLQGTFEYRVKENIAPDGSVSGHFIVSPSDTWVLGQESGENLLTLTACHPKYSARQRIIVQAELVGEPAPTVPRDEAVGLTPLTIESGAADERAADDEVVISDEVAADDDDSVDATGAPVDQGDGASETESGAAAPDDGTAEAQGSIDPITGEVEEVRLDTTDDGDAALASAQSPLGETEDFGEGLNGDRTKVKPAIMWGIAAGFIWLAAWFVGQRLDRKWTLYAVGLAPFGLVLWSAFVNIDQALPSY